MVKDRAEAGQLLAQKLKNGQYRGSLVLAVPLGGIEVGHHLAKMLGVGLTPLISRRLPDPLELGSAFGAIAEEGCLVIDENIDKWLSASEIRSAKNEQTRANKKWVNEFRQGRPLPEISGATVVLVDDGIITGFTMKAAIALCRKKGAKKIIVAVPMADEDAARELGGLAEEIVVLELLGSGRAAVENHTRWPEVPLERVREILLSWQPK